MKIGLSSTHNEMKSPIIGVSKDTHDFAQLMAGIGKNKMPTPNGRLDFFYDKWSKVKRNDPNIRMKALVDPAFNWIPSPYFMKTHPEFGNNMPPVDRGVRLRGPQTMFETHKLKSVLRVRSKGFEFDTKPLDCAQLTYNVWGLFGDLLTEGDYIKGPLTQVMTYSAAHTDLEEHGISSKSLGIPDKTPPIIYELLEKGIREVNDFLTRMKKYGYSTKNSLPVFTLPGFPYMGSGGSLKSASISVAFFKIAREAKSQGMSIQILRRILESSFGRMFLNEIYRDQVSGKILPEWIQDSFTWTSNLAVRRRAVFPSSKVLMAYAKEYANLASDCIFCLPSMARGPLEGRDLILKAVALENSRDYDKFIVKARDGEKADKHQGGEFLRNGTAMIERALNLPPGVLLTEYDMAGIQIRGSQIAEIAALSQLNSGGAHTTGNNCATYGLRLNYYIGSFCTGLSYTEYHEEYMKMFREAAKSYENSLTLPGAEKFSLADFKKHYKGARVITGPAGKYMQAAFGDDTAEGSTKTDEELDAKAKEINIATSPEASLRFLGLELGKGQLESNQYDSYNLGRMISTCFFPERKKESLYRKIGHLARIDSMPQGLGEEFHIRLKPFFPLLFEMDFTSIAEMKELYKSVWIPEATKKGNLKGELFDALAFLTKGDAELLYDLSSSDLVTDELLAGLDEFKIDLTAGLDVDFTALYGFDLRVTKILGTINSNPSSWCSAIINLFTLHEFIRAPMGVAY